MDHGKTVQLIRDIEVRLAFAGVDPGPRAPLEQRRPKGAEMGERDQFHIEHETPCEGFAVLSLHGDVDIYSAPAFKEALLQVIDTGAHCVLIDLTAAPFIDSTGLGVLVSGAKKAGSGTIAIVCAEAATRLIFQVIGFDRLFAVYDTRDGALGAWVAQNGAWTRRSPAELSAPRGAQRRRRR